MSASTSEVTAEQLVQRARALRPELVRQQAETEERTHFSPELHRALQDWPPSPATTAQARL